MKRAEGPEVQQGMSRFLDRLASFIVSIRFRLALWFAIVLALALVLFSAFIYIRQTQAVEAQAELRTTTRAHVIQNFIHRGMPDRGGDEGNSPLGGAPQPDQVVLQNYEVLFLVDTQGQVVRSYGLDLPGSDVSQLSAEIQRQNSSDPFFFTLSSGDERDYIFQALPFQYEGHLIGYQVYGQPVDPDNSLPRLLITLMLGTGVMALLALAGGYLLADRALAPVKTITRTAQAISDSDLKARINLKSRDELGQLAGTFDRMLDRLQAAFQRQRQFTADASHELRTPLTIVGLEVDRALEQKNGPVEKHAENYRRSLEVIRSENAFMARLVSELLTLARMDASPETLKRDPVDLSDVALEVIERYSAMANDRGVQLIAGELPEVTVLGDRTYLAQGVGNLVDNAIKYVPSGEAGGAPRWVKVETGAQDKTAWVRVSDNGPGIPAEHLPRLFDRFYRVDEARSHNPEGDEAEEDGIPGSGLGLSIVQRIAQVHGGQVTVASREGEGATFEIRLPVYSGDPPSKKSS